METATIDPLAPVRVAECRRSRSRGMREARASSRLEVVLATVLPAVLAATARAQDCPTSSFSSQPFCGESADIPGVAYGPNGYGQERVWIGSHCGGGCGSSGGSIQELDPATGQLVVIHDSPLGGWGKKGPAGLAHDGAGHLWVASQGDRKLYKVRLMTWTVVQTLATVNGPIGGLGVDSGGALWVGDAVANATLRIDPATGSVASYPVFPGGGIDCAGDWIALVRDTGVIEFRDLDFTLRRSYAFPLASDLGDLGIDPATGWAYWGQRGLSELQRMKLFDFGLSCAAIDDYCTAKTNSAGCTPLIMSYGTPSASAASGFHVYAVQVLPAEAGLLFYSVTGPGGAPFQGGRLCATPPTRRTPVQTSSNAGLLPCKGLYTFDFNARIASGVDPELIPGRTVWSQYWTRDYGVASASGLTNGLTFTIW